MTEKRGICDMCGSEWNEEYMEEMNVYGQSSMVCGECSNSMEDLGIEL